MDQLYFNSSDLSEFKLEPIVGPKSNSIVKGSAGLFIKALKSENMPTDLVGAKVNFEIREKGLLMYTSKSDKRWVFPLASKDLIAISLQGGEETYKAFPLSPMWLLLKLGMSIRVARKFKMKWDEYSASPCILILDTQDLDLALESSGYNIYSLMHFVKQVENLIANQD